MAQALTAAKAPMIGWAIMPPNQIWLGHEMRLPTLAQALDAAKAAVTGWEAGSVASRRGALDAAKVAAEFSQLCHKFMRSVHRT